MYRFLVSKDFLIHQAAAHLLWRHLLWSSNMLGAMQCLRKVPKQVRISSSLILLVCADILAQYGYPDSLRIHPSRELHSVVAHAHAMGPEQA